MQPKTDNLIKLLSISNHSFSMLSYKIEESIFFVEIIDSECPLEYQQENVDIKENFRNRFLITSSITGISIIESLINKKYGIGKYDSELKVFKKVIFSNLLEIREKILNGTSSYQFEDDLEQSLKGSEIAIEKFNYLTSMRSNEINRLVNKGGELKNIYYHFHQALGQILPEVNKVYYEPATAKLIDDKIIEIIVLLQSYFNNI